MSTKKITAVAILLLVLTLAAAGCGQSDATNPEDGSSPRARLEAVEPNEDDGAIYGATVEFINALVRNDRETVASLLTAEHRRLWTEDSYLLSDAAKAQYDDIALENLQYTVVKYMNNEETNFENTGVLFAVYDVALRNNGEEQERVKIQESLAFRKENGTWLISMDERGFLVEKK